MDGLSQNHFFFKNLLFHVLNPAPLLRMRLVCKDWARLVEDDIYWIRHRQRLIARLPSLKPTFECSSAPMWRVFAMLLAMGTQRQRNCKDKRRCFWVGVVESIVFAAHGRNVPLCVNVALVRRMRDDEFPSMVIWYSNARHVYLETSTMNFNQTTQTIRKSYAKKRRREMCLKAMRTGVGVRLVDWNALYGPFMAIVRNHIPCYAVDAHCLIKMPGGGNYLFFEEQ